MLETISKRSAVIGAEQRSRSIQDWATYLAHQAHGSEHGPDRGHGVDMSGVGRDLDDRMTRDASAATGILKVHVWVANGVPIVTGAVAGLEPEDAVHLRGRRIGSLRMPVQFHIAKHTPGGDRDPSVIVSRNEEGVLWLRDGNAGAREWLAQAPADRIGDYSDTVLRAAADILRQVDEMKLGTVGAA